MRFSLLQGLTPPCNVTTFVLSNNTNGVMLMTKTFSVRMPEELRERLAALAAAERRSMNNLILLLLEEALAARGQPAKRRA